METTTSPELDKYVRGLSQTHPAQYIRTAQAYLEYSGDTHDRTTVLSYLDKLRRSGHKESSLAFSFGVIRALFKRNGWDWEFRRGEGPQVQEDQVDAPAIDPEVIGEMIASALKGTLTTEEAAYLAVSTLYGVRRIELAELSASSVNLSDRTLYIATAKHGRARTHMIPDAIVPVLERHTFRPTSQARLTSIWAIIEYRVKFPHVERVGWHSVRRTLDTLLLDKLPPLTVASFMRWKKASSQNMTYRYSQVRFVGRDTATTRVFGEAKEVDTKVFEVHPFLPLWKSS